MVGEIVGIFLFGYYGTSILQHTVWMFKNEWRKLTFETILAIKCTHIYTDTHIDLHRLFNEKLLFLVSFSQMWTFWIACYCLFVCLIDCLFCYLEEMWFDANTCRDLARSQELVRSFLFNDNVFMRFLIVAPIPLFGVVESLDSRLSGCASKHFW